MTDHRTPLVLVTGLHRRLGAQVGTRFLDRPGTVVVHQGGAARTTVDQALRKDP